MLVHTAIAVALIAVAANASELSMEQGVLTPGKTVTLGMKLAAGADAPTGIQFDLEYDAASLDIAVEAGPAAIEAGKSLRTATVRAGKQRVLIFGFNRNVMSDGVLAILRVSYKNQDAGKTFPIHIAASSGTNQQAEPVTVTGRDGNVRVENGRNRQ